MKNLALLAAALLVTTPVFAQAQTAAPAQPQWQEVEDGDLVLPGLNLEVEDIEDDDLYDASGNEIGEIEEVLADASGQPVAVSFEPEDGLDWAEDDEDLVLPLANLRMDGERLVTDLVAEQLQALQRWDD